MTKRLKLKIKNAQLAEAFKLKQKKEEKESDQVAPPLTLSPSGANQPSPSSLQDGVSESLHSRLKTGKDLKDLEEGLIEPVSSSSERISLSPLCQNLGPPNDSIETVSSAGLEDDAQAVDEAKEKLLKAEGKVVQKQREREKEPEKSISEEGKKRKSVVRSDIGPKGKFGMSPSVKKPSAFSPSFSPSGEQKLKRPTSPSTKEGIVSSPSSNSQEKKEEKTFLVSNKQKEKVVHPPHRTLRSFKEKSLARTETRVDLRGGHRLPSEEEARWRKRKRSKGGKKQGNIEIVRPSSVSVRIPISVKELAQEMKLKAAELITKLLEQGLSLTINDILDDEVVIQLLGEEFRCQILIDTKEEERLRVTDQTIQEEIDQTVPEKLENRPPVIAFMGHVDHGKTSLIDVIRKSHLADEEAGAITQHIGAFRAAVNGGMLTILDTPGHEAFSMMRQRGAAVTDIVVLVVSGEEGIMLQTEEAIAQAQAAQVPIVVAINKCDRPAFNAEMVYRQLADHELLPEAWGGKVISVSCSAITKEGVDDLLELILLQAEMLELKANPSMRARGTVLEAQMHKGFGAVAMVLVQNGTLRLGDALVFDHFYAKIKRIHNEYGQPLKEAGPSTPVRVAGLSGIPEAGCGFIVVDNEKFAKKLCEGRLSGMKRSQITRRREPLDYFLQKQQERLEKKICNLVVRADARGSLEAIQSSLKKIQTTKVDLNFISSEVGEISESDVELAVASNAAIIGFNTCVESHAEGMIRSTQVTIKQRNIIYDVVHDVREIMLNLLEKARCEREVGTFVVKKLFKVSQLGVIAGGQVTDGVIKKNLSLKLFREEQLVWEGGISSLKKEQAAVKEVGKGLECGLLLDRFNEVEVGDQIKGFEIFYVQQEL